jgi:predicted ATP-dependent endonuclease of OLD family
MEEIFATKIKINEVLNIKDFEIPLSDTERRHLIITGKNGSGKTTLLNEIKKYLNKHANNQDMSIFLNMYESRLKDIQNQEDEKIKKISKFNKSDIKSEIELETVDSIIKDRRTYLLQVFGGIQATLNFPKSIYDSFISGDFIITFFGAKRNTELIAPSGITKVNLKSHYEIEDSASQDFIQYIVNLKADQSFAKGENKLEEAKKIDEWFNDFEEKILDVFDAKGAKLQFDRKTYNFNIVEPGKEPYNLNQLSDGYSAILNIVTELIMRMEEHKTRSYDVQGIVLIDEIETHLHIELQKKVLPFLTSFFPKIQFIVTTHSPFVINSIDHAVVCDLEKRIVLDNLSGYSYDAIVEGYFDADKYSTVLKQQVSEFEILMSKEELTDEENIKLQQLKKYLDGIPKFLSDELAVKLQQIKLKKLNKKV